MRPLGEPTVRLLRAAINRGGRPESPFVFPGRDPRRSFHSLFGSWRRIVGDSFSPHGLRHSFASVCDVSRHIWQLMTGEVLSAEVIELQRAGAG